MIVSATCRKPSLKDHRSLVDLMITQFLRILPFVIVIAAPPLARAQFQPAPMPNPLN